ncbi:unnamed protein product [Didymodactylos carnosus]|uniref:Uncharacterized protein n=1 Tax=Didymodactylos carnosus TaxID=1234261 RepID=A0A8S2F0R6_9BILA|nr:unnamed protein product [Didymodactylos carnosus]CAF4099040.1 unnamed protein product [Didymodactylos carnosus]
MAIISNSSYANELNQIVAMIPNLQGFFTYRDLLKKFSLSITEATGELNQLAFLRRAIQEAKERYPTQVCKTGKKGVIAINVLPYKYTVSELFDGYKALEEISVLSYKLGISPDVPASVTLLVSKELDIGTIENPLTRYREIKKLNFELNAENYYSVIAYYLIKKVDLSNKTGVDALIEYLIDKTDENQFDYEKMINLVKLTNLPISQKFRDKWQVIANEIQKYYAEVSLANQGIYSE